jgi:hypothetical protein
MVKFCPDGPWYLVSSWAGCGNSNTPPFVTTTVRAATSPDRVGYGDGFLMPILLGTAAVTTASFVYAAGRAAHRRCSTPSQAPAPLPVNQPFLPAMPPPAIV